MRWDLEGRAALVTGAGSGIGQAVALELARQGVKVAAADVNVAAAETTAKQAREAGADALPVAMDVSCSAEVRDGVATVEAALGPVDYLVNVAGTRRRSRSATSSGPGCWPCTSPAPSTAAARSSPA